MRLLLMTKDKTIDLTDDPRSDTQIQMMKLIADEGNVCNVIFTVLDEPLVELVLETDPNIPHKFGSLPLPKHKSIDKRATSVVRSRKRRNAWPK